MVPNRFWSWVLPEDPLDRRQFAALLAWVLVLGAMVGTIGLVEARRRQWITGLGFLVALPILIAGLFLAARIAWVVIARASRAFVATVLAAGNLPPAESTSAEEALIQRGRAAEAIASFEARIQESPRNVELRLRLSQLYQDQGDHGNAIRLLQEVRVVALDGRYETQVGNTLIDLYERLGDRGRLLAEYARFAANHPGTGAAAAAKKRLAALKAEIENPRAE